jgi:hypothetical protein
MLQMGGRSFCGMLVELFTDVLDPEGAPPDSWKQTRLKVLLKKGDIHDPVNYRPISMLPILYKVFSRLLLARIGAILDTAQPVDQASFRAGFGCEDHLFTIEIIL